MISPGFNVPFRIEMSLSGSRNLRIFFLMRLERVLLKVQLFDESLAVLL